MLKKYQYHIWLHIIVLIFGLTGVLGKLITTNSYLLVWYRVGIALISLICYFVLTQFSFKISKKELLINLGVGAIIAVHWVTFFEAIKQSNVSVALVCFSSTTFFTALLEPLYFKRKIKPYELLLGLLIIAGLYFVFSFELTYLTGIILAIFSAALASWFTVLNGILIAKTSAKTISFYELLGAFIVVSIYLFVTNGSNLNSYLIPLQDLKWLFVLGTLCTAFAFIMSVEVMKKISPYTVSMSINLEPIYAILLALIIWPESEKMSFGFYAGASVIIGTIFLNAFLKKRWGRN